MCDEMKEESTRFWLVRHAVVEENARAIIYGTLDVELCPRSLIAQEPMYAALARRLPRPATWLISPLSRTQHTAEAIDKAGYPEQALTIEPGLIELDFGDWQGLVHAEVPPRLTLPPHAFWPLGGLERPPGGESMADGIDRVGETMDRLAVAYAGQDVVAVSHGGTIRAAVAHALNVDADTALRLAVQNISLTRVDRLPQGWRVVCVNEMPGF
jgi:broad specificity phosphatase PhoE